MRNACLLLLAAAVGCAGVPTVTRDVSEPPRMVDSILGRVPVGTPVDDAQRFMESEGFACSRTVNQEDGDGLDCLSCDRSDGGLFSWVSQRWQVSIYYQDGKVAKVEANTGFVGP